MEKKFKGKKFIQELFGNKNNINLKYLFDKQNDT